MVFEFTFTQQTTQFTVIKTAASIDRKRQQLNYQTFMTFKNQALAITLLTATRNQSF
jgi:hypothetical protein